jgi:hypothetical protein
MMVSRRTNRVGLTSPLGNNKASEVPSWFREYYVGILDFYRHLTVMKLPSVTHYSGIRGSLEESQDFHHFPAI